MPQKFLPKFYFLDTQIVLSTLLTSLKRVSKVENSTTVFHFPEYNYEFYICSLYQHIQKYEKTWPTINPDCMRVRNELTATVIGPESKEGPDCNSDW